MDTLFGPDCVLNNRVHLYKLVLTATTNNILLGVLASNPWRNSDSPSCFILQPVFMARAHRDFTSYLTLPCLALHRFGLHIGLYTSCALQTPLKFIDSEFRNN